MAWRLITVKRCNTPAHSSDKSLGYGGSTESPSLGGELPDYEPTPTAWPWEDQPALYFLDEVLALRNRNQGDLREIHRAKLTYPGVRLIQEGPEKPIGQGASTKLMTRSNVK